MPLNEAEFPRRSHEINATGAEINRANLIERQ